MWRSTKETAIEGSIREGPNFPLIVISGSGFSTKMIDRSTFLGIPHPFYAQKETKTFLGLPRFFDRIYTKNLRRFRQPTGGRWWPYSEIRRQYPRIFQFL